MKRIVKKIVLSVGEWTCTSCGNSNPVIYSQCGSCGKDK